MDIDEILIEEVRQRPVIYDLGLADYKNLRKKEWAWREVSSNVHLDGEKCKKRWKGLRDCYKRCKRMEQSTSGSGAETPRRKWRYLEAMSFLDNVTSTRTTIGSIPEEYVVINEESFTAAETPPPSSRVRKEDERDKFESLIDLAASSITQTCSEFCMEKEQDSTELHFLSLAKKMKESGLPTSVVNRIEAKVSALVFSEIEAHSEALETRFYAEYAE